LNLLADGVAVRAARRHARARAENPPATGPRDLGEPDDTSKGVRYFLGGTAQGERPPRSGYYVGYLVARRVAGEKPLRELANLRGPELRAAIASALEGIVLTGDAAGK
jgi:hypothetical protein